MEEQSFHPLDYVSVLQPPEVVAHRCRWWSASRPARCSRRSVLPKRVPVARRRSAIAAPTLSPELLRGVSSLDRDRAAARRSSSTCSARPSSSASSARSRSTRASRPRSRRVAARASRHQRRRQPHRPVGRRRSERGIDSFKLGVHRLEPRRARSASPTGWPTVFVEENSQDPDGSARRTPPEVLGAAAPGQPGRGSPSSRRSCARRSRSHMGRLPDQIGANLPMVNGARSQLRVHLDAAPHRAGSACSMLEVAARRRCARARRRRR